MFPSEIRYHQYILVYTFLNCNGDISMQVTAHFNKQWLSGARKWFTRVLMGLHACIKASDATLWKKVKLKAYKLIPQGKSNIIKFAVLKINDMLQKVLSAELTLWLLSISFIVSFSLAKVGRSLGFSSQHFSIMWYLINKNYYQQQGEN